MPKSILGTAALGYDTPKAVKINTTEYWQEYDKDTSFMESIAYIYDLPATKHATDLCFMGVFSTDGGSTWNKTDVGVKSMAYERDLNDKYIKKAFVGIFEKADEIDALISENARGWKIGRLSKVTLAIIRISVYEMLYADIPVSISINEAIELAKKYADDSAPSFVNGILNTIAKQKGLK